MRRPCGREHGGVAERIQPESRLEWPEAVAVLWIGRKADNGDRAAVKVAFADDDLGLPLGDALDAIAPLARCLERRLDRFDPGVDRERSVESGQLGQTLQEQRQLVGV